MCEREVNHWNDAMEGKVTVEYEREVLLLWDVDVSKNLIFQPVAIVLYPAHVACAQCVNAYRW